MSYGVSVTAVVGDNEGDPVTVYIKAGDTHIVCYCLLQLVLREDVNRLNGCRSWLRAAVCLPVW